MIRIPLLAVALLAPFAMAQGGASTATNFGVLADDGTTTNLGSVAQGTAVGRGLGVHAAVGASMPRTMPVAFASSFVGPAFSFAGHGLLIHEEADVHNAAATGTLSAGTSADAPGTAAPTQAAHGISATFPVASGTQAVVSIAWDGRQSAGANVSAAIDVDGDGNPDWTGQGGTPARTQLTVTAGANGITLAITTNGSASVTGTGRAGYGASLLVEVRPGGTSGPFTFTWTAHGPQCLGSLAGSETLGANGGVRFDFAIAGAASSGIGILFAGNAAATPINLPSGSCQLLVDPSGAGLALFLTDANGNGSATLRSRARAMVVEYQAMTFGFASNALGTTNAVNLTVQ